MKHKKGIKIMRVKRLLVLPLCLGILATNTLAALAAPTPSATAATTASIVTNRDEINFSEMLRPGYLWVDIDLKGATFTATNPNDIMDAISTNYDVNVTLALKNNTSIELGHYDRNPNLKYKGDWKITIDSSVLSVPYDLTTTLRVVNDVYSTAKVTTVKSLTPEQLRDGVIIRMDIKNGAFNIADRGKSISKSMLNTSSIMLSQAALGCFCLTPSTVYANIKGTVTPFDRTFSFILDETTTNSDTPIHVSIEIER